MASVSEVPALLSWSSEGYISLTILSIKTLLMIKISSNYRDVVLKAFIISACLPSERDIIKSLS